jgi:hypothetical protein
MSEAPKRVYEERTLTGEIEATARDGSGFKIAGEWVSYGDYYQGIRPGRGQVVVAVAKGRFLRRLTVLDGGGPHDVGETAELPDDDFAGPPPPPGDDGDDDPATWGPPGPTAGRGWGAAPAPHAGSGGAAPRPAAAGARPAGRGADAGQAPRPAPAAPTVPAVAPPPPATSPAALRAAALAAAAHFHSGRGSEEDDVYGTAYRFLAWLTEEDGA